MPPLGDRADATDARDEGVRERRRPDERERELDRRFEEDDAEGDEPTDRRLLLDEEDDAVDADAARDSSASLRSCSW